MIEATFRPLENYPGVRTPEDERKRSSFSTTWSKTLGLLQRELRHLEAERVVIELDLRESQIRNDGWPRSGSHPTDDAVVVSFQSKHGPLRYFTDVFTGSGKLRGYQANLRAIALGLEALRKVDRYGITKRGEQYTGWKALTAGSSDDEHPEQSILAWADPNANGLTWHAMSYSERRAAVRTAKRRAHPDAGGNDAAFVAVSQAAASLGF